MVRQRIWNYPSHTMEEPISYIKASKIVLLLVNKELSMLSPLFPIDDSYIDYYFVYFQFVIMLIGVRLDTKHDHPMLSFNWPD